jgi:hypothetical protein
VKVNVRTVVLWKHLFLKLTLTSGIGLEELFVLYHCHEKIEAQCRTDNNFAKKWLELFNIVEQTLKIIGRLESGRNWPIQLNDYETRRTIKQAFPLSQFYGLEKQWNHRSIRPYTIHLHQPIRPNEIREAARVGVGYRDKGSARDVARDGVSYRDLMNELPYNEEARTETLTNRETGRSPNPNLTGRKLIIVDKKPFTGD